MNGKIVDRKRKVNRKDVYFIWVKGLENRKTVKIINYSRFSIC